MTQLITSEMAITTLREVVAGKEEFVYTKVPDLEYGGVYCVNAVDGCPSCIVGHVLAKLGVPIEFLEKYRFAPATVLATHLPDAGFKFTQNAIKVLTQAQATQDAEYPWGHALHKAELTYAELQYLA